MERVGKSARETVQSRLGRSVHVIGPAYAPAGDRGKDHQGTAADAAHAHSQAGQQRDLSHIVDVHYRGGMFGIGLGPRLVTQQSERKDCYVDGPVPLDDGIQYRLMGVKPARVKLNAVDTGSACLEYAPLLFAQVICPARGQHHRVIRRQSGRHLESDLAAAPKDHHR
ncbi:Uncharacterised protein [Mycobacteroides abscessus]|nr:Uncharacterised protein [Mycobacteroides abscessus]